MEKTLPRVLRFISGGLLGVALALTPAGSALAAPPERYLHVTVDDREGGETVRVNVPLSMAEKVLPTIDHGDLHHGKVRINHDDLNGVDPRALLDAVRTTPDNEFVSVKEHDQDVRVAKSGGNLLIRVRDKSRGNQKVDVSVPMTVAQALLSADKDELDLLAAVRALEQVGDTLLVSVEDGTQTVRVWVDSHNASEK